MACRDFFMGVIGLAALGMTHAAAADLGASSKNALDDVYRADSDDFGPGWMIRARILDVVADKVKSGVGAGVGATTDVDYSVVPEVDLSYFFTKNWAVELIVGVTQDDISARLGPAALDVGQSWMLPAMAALQYHFDVGYGIKPYVGAGASYTAFFNEKGGQFGSLKIDDAFGWALQAGVDIHLRDNWYLNIDVKKLWLDTEATIAGVQKADVSVEPLIVGAGIGYKFGGARESLK